MHLAEELSRRTSGFTGADLGSLCQKAGLAALQRLGWGDEGLVVDASTSSGEDAARLAALEVTQQDFAIAAHETAPSVTPAMLARLERWREAYLSQ